MQKNIKQWWSDLKSFDWKMYLALCLLALVPAIYQTIITKLITVNTNPGALDIIGILFSIWLLIVGAEKLYFGIKFMKKQEDIFPLVTFIAILSFVMGLLVLFNPEARIKRRVKSMGKEFYTEYFWDSLADARSKKELNEVMNKFVDTGFKVRFNTLSTYGSGKWKKEIDDFELKNKKCNQVKSMVIIYPKKDFSKHDYKIEVVLDCNIEK